MFILSFMIYFDIILFLDTRFVLAFLLIFLVIVLVYVSILVLGQLRNIRYTDLLILFVIDNMVLHCLMLFDFLLLTNYRIFVISLLPRTISSTLQTKQKSQIIFPTHPHISTNSSLTSHLRILTTQQFCNIFHHHPQHIIH
jgi:hypothetical protein